MLHHRTAPQTGWRNCYRTPQVGFFSLTCRKPISDIRLVWKGNVTECKARSQAARTSVPGPHHPRVTRTGSYKFKLGLRGASSASAQVLSCSDMHVTLLQSAIIHPSWNFDYGRVGFRLRAPGLQLLEKKPLRPDRTSRC